MRSTQQFSITLPNEMAKAVEAKVADGEYATENEVIREGLRSLLARDRAIERWLHTEVAAAYDQLKSEPSKALTPNQVRATLAAARQRRAAAPVSSPSAEAEAHALPRRGSGNRRMAIWIHR